MDLNNYTLHDLTSKVVYTFREIFVNALNDPETAFHAGIFTKEV